MSEEIDNKPLAIASDHAGYALKEQVKIWLSQWGVAYRDLGAFDERATDYPDYAHAVADGIYKGQFSLAILVCGSGLGMGMAANRHAGVRAAVCTDSFTARSARTHNDANVLCLGSRVVGVGVARDIVKTFLEASFEGGRHIGRVAKIENR
ncbi:MAG: ribose 5-phosphate isomerase B [Deltaproteobacteria bacterium]|nr:ribose 5-phosphate isomerase B [Deltaproteobacteria bacterium]